MHCESPPDSLSSSIVVCSPVSVFLGEGEFSEPLLDAFEELLDNPVRNRIYHLLPHLSDPAEHLCAGPLLDRYAVVGLAQVHSRLHLKGTAAHASLTRRRHIGELALVDRYHRLEARVDAADVDLNERRVLLVLLQGTSVMTFGSLVGSVSISAARSRSSSKSGVSSSTSSKNSQPGSDFLIRTGSKTRATLPLSSYS